MAVRTLAPLLLVLLASVLVSSQGDIRLPPGITKPDSEQKLYFTQGSRVVIGCQATGNPLPTYKWISNGTVVEQNDWISFDSSTGDLTISDFSQREEATYMCIASNVFDNSEGGRITASSLSPPVTLFQIRLARFLPMDDVTKQVTEYSYVMQKCSGKGKVVANDLVYSWYMTPDAAEVSMDGGRLYIDMEGNLHFSYVLQKDATVDFSYMCGVSSKAEKVIVLGNQNYLTVTPVSYPSAIKPRLQHSNTGSKVQRFGEAKLECVFSGYDPVSPHIPVTRWYDDAGVEITTITNPNKYSLSSDRRVLTIKNVQEEDERNYYCEAENQAGNSGKQAVFLDVTSAPIFLTPGAPVDQTVPEGQDVVFLCDARSAATEEKPGPPTWYINTHKAGAHLDRHKFIISEDKKSLTIRNVRKATDILCVQCEVSNHVGTTWGDACLNVVLPIELVQVPELHQEVVHGDVVDLTVLAVTDPLLTLNYRWEFKNQTYDGIDFPPYVWFDQNFDYDPLHVNINTSMLNEDQFEEIEGTYRRVIYNKFESKTVDINVSLLKPTPPPSQTNSNSTEPDWLRNLIRGINNIFCRTLNRQDLCVN